MFRRDAVAVWANEVVAKRLARYRAIIDQRLTARFHIAKLVEVQYEPNDDLEALWHIHDEARIQFQELLSKEKPIDYTSSSPAASFLDLKRAISEKILQQCHFCERRCNIDRTKQTGFCGVPRSSYVQSAFLHTGEEAPLVPSGTIFFSGCNFRCAHCQNYDISYNPTSGTPVSAKQLAEIADGLASSDAKNINYVGGDPTPNLHTILASLLHQTKNITQLWNSNMYLTSEAMELLVDIMDFWLPDLKYFSNICANRISDVEKYCEMVTRNIRMAYDKGSKEMIIRVLVLPNHIECCVEPILEWIAENTPNSLVNIMAQYRPEFRVKRHPEDYRDISRRVTREEMQHAYSLAEQLGLEFRSVS
ncbi:MAG: radical SAM protein [Promethearchaeota archaeon]